MDTPTIVLIDDSPDDAKLIVEALSRVVPQERIRVCVDGADALDYFQRRGAYAVCSPIELPALVLLDLHPSQPGGLHVLRDIRAHPLTRLLPVTILSTSDQQEDVRAAAQLGANSFVRKARDGKELRDTLSKLALYWLQLNVPPPLSARQ